jgi:hypothetical protein
MMKKVGIATKHRDALLGEAAQKVANKQAVTEKLAAPAQSKKEKDEADERFKQLKKEAEAARKK